MNARRVVHAMPWMLRLCAGGALRPMIMTYAALFIVLAAIRLVATSVTSIPLHLVTTLPAFVGLMALRQQRHRQWNFLAGLPFSSGELVTSALLVDIGFILLLAILFPFPNARSAATEVLVLWTVVMVGGFSTWPLWGRMSAGVAAGFISFVPVVSSAAGPEILVMAATAALGLTGVEIWMRLRAPRPAATTPAAAMSVLQAGVRLPFVSLRRTQLGMMLMGDKFLALWAALYVGVWLLDGLSRAAPGSIQLVQFTFMIAASASAMLCGKPAEFFVATPLPRARRLTTFMAIAVFCIAAPGVTRLLTVATPQAASRRLEYVSHTAGGCRRSEQECEKRFSSSIRRYQSLPYSDLAVDAIAAQAQGKAVFHPGPRAVAAFRSTIMRAAILVTLQLTGVFIVGLLTTFYQSAISVGPTRRMDAWFGTAILVLTAALFYDLFASEAWPLHGLALLVGLALCASLLLLRLRHKRFALP